MTVKTTIAVTDDQAARLEEAVRSGAYASTSEVVRAALRDWIARQDLQRLWREGIESGLAQSDLDAETLKSEARRRRDGNAQ